MWIRSKNKKFLVNCDVVFVIKRILPTENSYYAVETHKDSDLELGAYPSYEKALKVLDMIENAIGGVPETDIKGNVIGIAVKRIFQMPQDEEVK